jgi:hypothetical protein
MLRLFGELIMSKERKRWRHDEFAAWTGAPPWLFQAKQSARGSQTDMKLKVELGTMPVPGLDSHFSNEMRLLLVFFLLWCPQYHWPSFLSLSFASLGHLICAISFCT